MDAARPIMNEPTDLAPEAGARVTPMMEQYIEIKAANPDSLLFYRMGDFYELFFDDAEVASRALGIVLTKRGKHLGRDIPMCGVPIERADEYLQRLIARGHRVAVCEQLEDPAEARKRGTKSVVRRDVVRLVTPGTLTEDSLLEARSNNYLLAMARARQRQQIIVALGIEQRVLGERAGRHQPHHVAAHHALVAARPGRGGIFHLLAHRDAMTGCDQAMQIVLGALHRHAAHRDIHALVLAAFGQHDAERARGNFGVFEEQLVEIAHPVEQQQPGIGRLYFKVLFHHRRHARRDFGGWRRI